MKEKTGQKWIAYGVNAIVALVIVSAVSLRQGFSLSQPLRESCRDLSDGFFVAGLMMTGIGVLNLIGSTGFFDIFSYGVRTLLSHFTPQKSGRDFPKYYDYKMERAENRKPPLRATLWVGLICVALSVICVVGYYSM